MRRTSLVDRLPPLASALPATSERTKALLAAASNLYGYCPVDAPITAATPFGRDYPKLRDSPCGYLGRCPCRAAGWPDPHDRDPLQRLHRGELQDSVRYTTTTRICAKSGGLRGSRKRGHLPHSPTGTSAHQLLLLLTVVRSRRHVRSRAGLQWLGEDNGEDRPHPSGSGSALGEQAEPQGENQVVVHHGHQVRRPELVPRASRRVTCMSFADKLLNRVRMADMNSGTIDGDPASTLKITQCGVHALPGPADAARHLLLS